MNNKLLKKSFLSLVLLSAVILFGSCSGQKVQTVQEETEANKIIDVLRENGINAYKVETGEGEKASFDIYVSGGEEEYGAAIQLMEDHCLPQPIPPQVETSGLVSSIEVEKAQELRRTKINLESQLRKLYGTTCVDITIVPPEKSSLSLNPYKASATVLVKYKTEKYGLTVDQIASMVARGVQGLTVDNVHVTLSQQPLRQLPDINRGRNIRRIIYVSVIGLITILLFIGIVLFLRKRKGENQTDSDIDEFGDQAEVDLIDEGQSIDEEKLIEDNQEVNDVTDDDSEG